MPDPAADMLVAHINRTILRHDWNDPRSGGFVDAITAVNAIAERSPGFVWRDGDETAKSQALPFLDGHPRAAISFSVWESVADLEAFVYKTLHGAFYQRASEWFLPPDGPTHALWFVPKATIPSFKEADLKMKKLITDGPSWDVFDFTYWRDHLAGEETT